MKLIIQIPCYNEEKNLALALAELPREVPGFDHVEWLVIDDGSTDETRKVAREQGVDHIVGYTRNQGLARGFMLGLDACVRHGADVIVNTDADNQYDASYIPNLTQPILDGKADMVIGSRPIQMIEHFSFSKKILQRLGSSVVRKISHTNIPDAPSGFRAFSRDAAMKLNVFNEYTYTLETIIQAGMKQMAVTSVPVEVNDDLRPSKLVKSISSYIKKSIITMLRIFVVYKPFRFFLAIGLALFSMGLILGLRFLYFYLFGDGQGHIQSVVLAGVMMGIGFQTFLVAFVADLLSVNRKLLEEVQYRLRKLESQPEQAD
ncbi:MAG: glycosyltransferase family 2 protein [Candidatus Thiodiazotropha sp. (ex Ustalcina ferruginea)]|nr:glycosyltransferase family 2 protein [Candidatus Thiodiazotropha sp. (ex Ustalcina ferruginea)]